METFKRNRIATKIYISEKWEQLLNFCYYWWFRYLMVTELYMVEKWERVTIHILFVVLFFLFWYFNYSVLLSFTGNLLGIASHSDMVDHHKLLKN